MITKAESTATSDSREQIKGEPPLKGLINSLVENQDLPIPNRTSYSFYLFANSRSGSTKGAQLRDLGIEDINFSHFQPRNSHITLHIYDLLDSGNRDRGLKQLKEELKEGKTNVRVVSGGGDGSTMWVVELMEKHEVPFENCVFGVVPFGTGNHFSRTLGWGKKMTHAVRGAYLEGLKSLMSQWVEAEIEKFDLWEVTIECYEEGGIKQVTKLHKRKQREVSYLSNKDEFGNEKKILTYRRKMSNYFSFGFDAAVGFAFEQHRTKSRIKNGLTYFWNGIKQSMKLRPKITDYIRSIERLDIPENVIPFEKTDLVSDKTNDFVIHPSTDDIPKDGLPKDSRKHAYIDERLLVILFLNIPHYAGGSDIWDSKKSFYGTVNESKEKIKGFAPEKYDDGLLEILGFKYPSHLFMGKAAKLWQTSGPTVVNFNRHEDPKKPIETYFEIDGEHYQLIAPKKAVIRRAPQNPTINVMRKKDKKIRLVNSKTNVKND